MRLSARESLAAGAPPGTCEPVVGPVAPSWLVPSWLNVFGALIAGEVGVVVVVVPVAAKAELATEAVRTATNPRVRIGVIFMSS